MSKFTKLVAPALVAVLGFSAVAPTLAEAAPYNQNGRYMPAGYTQARYSIRTDIAELRTKIDRAAARRTISQTEASHLRREAADVQRLYANFSRRGLTSGETRMLESRVNRVYVALRMERHDYDGHRG